MITIKKLDFFNLWCFMSRKACQISEHKKLTDKKNKENNKRHVCLQSSKRNYNFHCCQFNTRWLKFMEHSKKTKKHMQTNDSKHQENNDFEGTNTHIHAVYTVHTENTHRKWGLHYTAVHRTHKHKTHTGNKDMRINILLVLTNSVIQIQQSWKNRLH